MALPSRFAPPTQLDALRILLRDFSERDPGFQAQFDKSLDTLRQLALPELGQRLAAPGTPWSLRQLILKAAGTFDWPEWDQHLVPFLKAEEDPDLLDEGCAALGALCTRRAMEGLVRLKGLRHDPRTQELLDRELLRYQSNFTFEDALAWLQEGIANPVLARMGARALAGQEEPGRLEDLRLAYQRGDGLARHLVLHVLAFHPEPEAQALLLTLFREAEEDLADHRRLADLLEELESAPRGGQRERLLGQFEARFGEGAPETIQALRKALASPGGRSCPDLKPCVALAQGPCDAFLLDAMALVASGKTATFSNLLRETAPLVALRLLEQNERLDDLGALVAFQVVDGKLALQETLPILEAAFQLPAGGAGLLIAYLRLVPVDDRARLDRILAEPEVARRVRCVEALGAREEDGLVPFFLRAMNDEAKEVGQSAIHQVGKLPSAFGVMMDLFRSGHLDRVREAIQFFSENRTAGAAKPLLGFLSSESSDELLVDAVKALGNIADPGTANGMLAQLHSGKPLVLQEALVEALTRLRTAPASLGLLKKSEELTMPPVLLLALKGALAAFPSFETPFPPAQVPTLEHLVERCCDSREGAGQWLSAALGVQDLFVFDQALYERLRDRFNAFLVEMHHRPSWERKSHDLALDVLKKLTRRAASLSRLEDRERTLENLIGAMPPEGPRRKEVMLELQMILSDPDLTLSPPCAQALVAFLEQELARDAGDFHEMELLCELAGLSGQAALVEPLRACYLHASGVGRKSFARKALLALGLTDKEIDRRMPIQTILVLEPNAFFRKRILSALEGPERTLAAADSRQAAEALLASAQVDLLLSESHDPEGDLIAWLEGVWQRRACRYVLLSTANHDLQGLADKPWIIAKLYKPYPIEDLQKAIED